MVDPKLLREHPADLPADFLNYFVKSLDTAWSNYNSGMRNVDCFEDNFTELAYAKGFREGFIVAFDYLKSLPEKDSKINNEPAE